MEIQIGNKKISKNSKPYFIADIGANHDGDLERALSLIELSKDAGADAAKFQNFQAPKIVSKYGFENMSKQLSHQTSWKKSVYQTYTEASIAKEWTSILKEKCDEVGIEYMTSPYDYESVDLVNSYVNMFKIGSGDISWIEIIEHIASKQKPTIIATGASTLEDVERAYNAAKKLNNEIILMQCNTNYTGAYENFNHINLNVLKTFKNKFPKAILGLSDHTKGHSTVLGALALGGTIFEKHFTDDNRREGPDHKFAMNPESWKEMVEKANELYLSLGDGVKRVEANEKDSIIVQRRSIRAKRKLQSGSILRKDDFEFLRPIEKNDLEPFRVKELIGKKLLKPLHKGQSINLSHIQ